MSRAVDGLVKKRLATRVEDPEDRRVRRVAITAKGKKLVDTLVVVRQAGMETFAASLTAAQRRKLDAAVDSLMDREDIAEAYRAPEGGRTSLTRYRHLITDDNRKWWTLGAMCFALFMIMLDNTVVNVALPSIQRDLHASISGLEWTINGYTLSFAVLLATGGRLGDIFGRRRMFLFGVIIFALSSATAGLAAEPDRPGRQPRRPGRRRGADDAGDALDHHRRLPRRTSAARRWGSGPASRPWRSRSARCSAASSPSTSAGGRSSTSTSRSRSAPSPPRSSPCASRATTPSAARSTTPASPLLTGALTALILALVEGNGWGWGSTEIVALLVGAAVGLAAFVAVELRVKVPMVEFRFFSDRNFLGAVVVALIISFAMLGVFFFLALYMQDILRYSPLEAGVRFLPSTLMIVGVAPVAGRLADRFGPRWLIAGGLGIVAASLYSFSGIAVDSSYLDLLPGFMLLGIGIALTMSPMTSAAMNAVAVEKAGIASGVLSMFRMVGGSLGVAVTGAIFQGSVGTTNFAEASPQQFVDALGQAMSSAPSSPSPAP